MSKTSVSKTSVSKTAKTEYVVVGIINERKHKIRKKPEYLVLWGGGTKSWIEESDATNCEDAILAFRRVSDSVCKYTPKLVYQLQATKFIRPIIDQQVQPSSAVLSWEVVCSMIGYQGARLAWSPPRLVAEETELGPVELLHSKNLELRAKLLDGCSEIGSYPGIEPLLLDGILTCQKRKLPETPIYTLSPQYKLMEDYNYTTDFCVTISKTVHVSVFTVASSSSLFHTFFSGSPQGA